MASHLTVGFRSSEVQPEQTWQLLDYCLARGASEFTVTLMSSAGASPRLAAFEAALHPLALPPAPRELLTAMADEPWVRETPLWRLVPEAVPPLRAFFPDGLFDNGGVDREAGWLEDPILYRDGRVMLEVVSHEGEGMLRLTPAERVEVHELGILTHIEG